MLTSFCVLFFLLHSSFIRRVCFVTTNREKEIRGFYTPVSATYKSKGNKGRKISGLDGWIDRSRGLNPPEEDYDDDKYKDDDDDDDDNSDSDKDKGKKKGGGGGGKDGKGGKKK